MKAIHLLVVGLTLLSSRMLDPRETGKPFVVIVNKANKYDSLSRAQLRIIFLRKVSRWPWGAETVPVDLAEGSPVREAFIRTVLATSREHLAVYWIDQKVTLNLDPPIRVANAAVAKAVVASKAGAVAYIPPEALDGTVKILQVK